MMLPGGRLVRFVDLCDPGEATAESFERCEIGKQVKFDAATLVQFRLGKHEAIVDDALLLAAAVEYCDRRQCRGEHGRSRTLHVRIPVYEFERFRNAQVLSALRTAARTLTGDKWTFEFKQRTTPRSEGQHCLAMPASHRPIVPFSDGMDSWSLSQLLANQDPVLLRLGRPEDKGKRKRRANAKRTQPLEEIPFQIPKKGLEERSGRGRGFKVAMVSGVAAWLTGSTTVVLPESGQGALGPVLAKHRYGDYRSHPEFLAKMGVLLNVLLEHEIRYDLPRLAYTKGETLRAAVDATSDDTWQETRTCWQWSRNIPIRKRQCGFCAACLLRRLSVHAASLEEPTDAYACEDLSAPSMEAAMMPGFDVSKLQGKPYAYAVAGMLHLDHLADLHRSNDAAGPLGRSIRSLARAMGREEMDVTRDVQRMLAQHDAEWRAFLLSLAPASFIRQRCAAP